MDFGHVKVAVVSLVLEITIVPTTKAITRKWNKEFNELITMKMVEFRKSLFLQQLHDWLCGFIKLPQVPQYSRWIMQKALAAPVVNLYRCELCAGVFDR